MRHSKVRFSSEDHYIVGPNPDDSGKLDFDATLPVVGLMFAATPALHFYVTAGRGFETPTLNELAYRPNGQTGLNLALGAATSDSYEAGVKTRNDWGDVNVALFETRTSNEIATLSNVGGRSTFQNVGSTRRRGLEAAWSADLRENLRAQARLHPARRALPRHLPDLHGDAVPGRRTSPSRPATASRASPATRSTAPLGWVPPLGWRGGVEARALSKVWVNDANSDAAAGFATVNANVGYVARVGSVDLTGFARVDNLFGRNYAGSVIVNEGNARYFEPAPTRNWTVGLTATVGF